jgi:hypothetical protein
VRKPLAIFKKLNWILALIVAIVAAVAFQQGYQELAAVIWLGSLILVLPMWSDPNRSPKNRYPNPPND